MRIETNFGIKTTSACNGSCAGCSARAWMKKNPGLHTTIENLEQFIHYSKLSGYTWKLVTLSGGEPTLWKYLVDGTKLLKESGIVETLAMFTNAVDISKIDKIINYMDRIRVSIYDGNEQNGNFLVNKYGKKISVVNYKIRPYQPTSPIRDSLPANCGCRGAQMTESTVDVCGPSRTIAFSQGWEPEYARPLGINFMEYFLGLYKSGEVYNQRACMYCIGNKNILGRIRHGKCRV